MIFNLSGQNSKGVYHNKIQEVIFMKMKLFKKSTASGVVKGIGIAMAAGGAAAIIGSSVLGNTKLENVKKNVVKTIKSMENMF